MSPLLPSSHPPPPPPTHSFDPHAAGLQSGSQHSGVNSLGTGSYLHGLKMEVSIIVILLSLFTSCFHRVVLLHPEIISEELKIVHKHFHLYITDAFFTLFKEFMLRCNNDCIMTLF